jgi:hypothetical protein
VTSAAAFDFDELSLTSRGGEDVFVVKLAPQRPRRPTCL